MELITVITKPENYETETDFIEPFIHDYISEKYISLSVYGKELIKNIRKTIINHQKTDNITFTERYGTALVVKKEYEEQAKNKYKENEKLRQRIEELEKEIERLGGSIMMNGITYPEVVIPDEWRREIEYVYFEIKYFSGTKFGEQIDKFQALRKL